MLEILSSSRAFLSLGYADAYSEGRVERYRKKVAKAKELQAERDAREGEKKKRQGVLTQ